MKRRILSAEDVKRKNKEDAKKLYNEYRTLMERLAKK